MTPGLVWGQVKVGRTLQAVGETLGPQFASAAFYSVLGSVSSQLLNMLGVWAAAMLLGSVSFGKVAMVQSTTSMLGSLCGMGLGTTATSYVSRFRVHSPERAANIVSASSAFVWGLGLLMAVGLYLTSPMISASLLHDPELTGPLRFASAAVLFQALSNAQSGTLAGFEAFRAIAIGNGFRGILSVTTIPFAAWVWGVNGAVLAYVLSSALVCAFNEALLRRQCLRFGLKPRFRNAVAEYRVLAAFSLPMLMSGVLVGPITWLANALLVNEPGGYAELGIYAAAERWRLAILFAPTCLAGVALPKLSSSRMFAGRFRSCVLAYGAVVVLLAAAPATVVALTATPIMSALGSGYANGGNTLVLLALASVAVAANTALGQALLSSGLPWIRFAVDVALAAAFLGLCTWFIPMWRSAGMAGAYLVSYTLAVVLLAALTPYMLRRAESTTE